MIRIWMLTWPLTPQDPKKTKSVEKTPLVKAESVESYESTEVPVTTKDRIHPIVSGRGSEDQTSSLKPLGKSTDAPKTYKENGYVVADGRESALPLKANDPREDDIVPDTGSTLKANPRYTPGGDGLDNEEDRHRQLHPSQDKGIKQPAGTDSRYDGLTPSPKQTLFQMANDRNNPGQNSGTDDRQRTLSSSPDSQHGNHANEYPGGDETSLLMAPGRSRAPGGIDGSGHNAGADGHNRYGAIPGETNGNSPSDSDNGVSSARYPNSDGSMSNGHGDDTNGYGSEGKANLLIPPSGRSRKGSNGENERNPNLKRSERHGKELPSGQTRGRRLEESPGRNSKSRSPSLKSTAKRPSDKDDESWREPVLREEKPAKPTVRKMGFGSTYKQPKPVPNDPSKDSKKRKGTASSKPKGASEVIEPEMVRNTKTQKPLSKAPAGSEKSRKPGQGQGQRQGETANSDRTKPGQDTTPGSTAAATPENGGFDAETPLTFVVPEQSSQTNDPAPQEEYIVLYNDIEDSDGGDRDCIEGESSTDLHTLPRRPKPTSGTDHQAESVARDTRALQRSRPGHLDLQFDAGEASDDPYDDQRHPDQRRDADAGRDERPGGPGVESSQRVLQGSSPAYHTLPGDRDRGYDNMNVDDPRQGLRRPAVDEVSETADVGDAPNRKGKLGRLPRREGTDSAHTEVNESTPVAAKMAAPRGAAGTARMDDPGEQAPRGGVGGAPSGKDADRSQRELQGSRPATLTTAGGDADSIGMNDPHGQPLRRPAVDEDSLAEEGGRRTKGSPGSLNVRRAAGDEDVIVPEDANVSHAQLKTTGAGRPDEDAPRGGVGGAPAGNDAARSQRELQGSRPATLTAAGGDADSIGMNDPHGQPLRRPAVDEDSLAEEGGRRTKGSPGSLNVRRAAGDEDVIVPEDANVSHAQLKTTGSGRPDGDSPTSLDVRRAAGDEDVIVPEGASVSHAQLRPSGGISDNGRGRQIDVLSGQGNQPDGRDTPSSQREMEDPGFSTRVMSTARPSDRDGMTDGQRGAAVRRPGDRGSPPQDTDPSGKAAPRGGVGGAPAGNDAARSQRELQGSRPATLTTAGGDADSIGMNDPHGQPLHRPAVDEDSLAEEGGGRTKGSPGSLNVRRAAGDEDVIVPEDANVSHAQLKTTGAGRPDVDGDSPTSLDVRRAAGDEDVIVPEGASISHAQLRPSGGIEDNGRGRQIDVLSGQGNQPDGRDTPSSQREMEDPGFSTRIMSTARPSDRDGMTDGQRGAAVRRPGDRGSPPQDTDPSGKAAPRGGVGGALAGKDAARSQRELQGSRPATLTAAGGDADSIGMNDPHGRPLRRPAVDEDSLAEEGGRRTKGSPGSLNVRRAAGDEDVIVPEDAHVSHAQLKTTGAGRPDGDGDSPTSLDVRRAAGDEDAIVPEGASVSHAQLRPSGGIEDNGRGRQIDVLSGQGNQPDGRDTPSSQREMEDPGFSTRIMSTARPSDRDGMTDGQRGAAVRRPGDGGSPPQDTDPSGKGIRDTPDREQIIADKQQTVKSQNQGPGVGLIEKGPLTAGERRHAEALKSNAFIDRVHIELPPVRLRIIIYVRPGCLSIPYNAAAEPGQTPEQTHGRTPAQTPAQTPAETQQKKQSVTFGDTPAHSTTQLGEKSTSFDEGETARKRKTFARVSRKGSRRLSRLRSFKRSSSLEDVECLEPVMPDLAPVGPADKRNTMMKKTRSLDNLDDDQPFWFDRHQSIDLNSIEARRLYTRELEIIPGDSVKQLVKGFEDYSRRVSKDWT
ncbi:collagen alpha-1(III) chain-like isoform X15 [Haliotis rufescens]|uniref:collagen alpha-1(III) chain-like isoform X15 n=1 Tax=Haliotis rufescens TaxID=6454 RepID=UPI00201E9DB5|nr:collagen alpha-1(III) chain-like isoform X15 [Haliotis rufescens]